MCCINWKILSCYEIELFQLELQMGVYKQRHYVIIVHHLQDITVVDTPGFGDSDKEDSVLIDEMMGVLKNTVKSASVLLLVLDGNQVPEKSLNFYRENLKSTKKGQCLSMCVCSLLKSKPLDGSG